MKKNFQLLQACRDGDLKQVKHLVNFHKANIRTSSDECLKWASERGHLEVVKYLLENGSDIHAQNDYALRTACFFGRFEVVKYLVEKGADIQIYTERTGSIFDPDVGKCVEYLESRKSREKLREKLKEI